ncbi:hypothetical protein MW887_011549 [Aspergillus wentii]|nr:hypothetical protein MW887_011549 [Aspergillus wentii]
MNRNVKRKPRSCVRCREQHLKCNGEIPCDSCQKSKSQCDPTNQVRFRTEPRAKRSFSFSPDQKWVNPMNNRQLTYVDMNPTVNRNGNRTVSEGDRLPTTNDGQTTSRSLDQEHRNPTPPSSNIAPLVDDRQTRSKYPLGPLHGLSDSYTDDAYLSLEEACLIRHFAENLAPWFEISDRDRHFTLCIPERAMFCPVLRYAVYTASAGHLMRLSHCRGQSVEKIVFDGIPLPGLNFDSAIRYHDICISYLIEISNDPEEEYNEDVLTAATILRFYEQIDAPSTGHSETYLHAIQFIISTQHDESFYAYQTIQGPPRDADVHIAPSISLRHSACLIALRQEIWSAFLFQRPVRLPVSPSNDYTSWDPASDFVWTNRIFVWVADLLGFCFGNRTMTPEESLQRWLSLKSVEQRWKAEKPPSFRPIYYRKEDPQSGRYFPGIWHMNECQVAGAQHMALGRILLAVSDPTRVSRLGIGAISRNMSLQEELRGITRELCGLGISNAKCPVAIVTAVVGISVCGEYFTDAGEQEAMVKIMEDLEFEYAWPTAATIRALRSAWMTSL